VTVNYIVTITSLLPTCSLQDERFLQRPPAITETQRAHDGPQACNSVGSDRRIHARSRKEGKRKLGFLHVGDARHSGGHYANQLHRTFVGGTALASVVLQEARSPEALEILVEDPCVETSPDEVDGSVLTINTSRCAYQLSSCAIVVSSVTSSAALNVVAGGGRVVFTRRTRAE
jgi:hypothetical protein